MFDSLRRSATVSAAVSAKMSATLGAIALTTLTALPAATVLLTQAVTQSAAQAQSAPRSAQLLYTLTGHNGGVNTVAFTPFNHYAVSGSVDRTIRLWDLRTGETVRTLNNSHAVNNITLSPDGNKIYGTGPSYKPSVKIWQRETGQLKQVISDFETVVRAMDVSSDSEVLAAALLRGVVELWDTRTGDRLKTLTGHTDYVTAVAFAPGGRTLVTGSAGRDRSIRVWNVEKGEERYSITPQTNGHKDWVLDVDVASNGRVFASASADKTIKLWDVETGRLIRTFTGHSSWVRSVQISRNNDYIVSGSKDGSVKVWDLKTGTMLYSMDAKERGIDEVRSVAFASDNKTVMAGLTNSKVKIWRLQ